MFEPLFIEQYTDEKSYRADKTAYNYSLLADFSKKSPLGFYKKYYLNEDEDETKSIAVGKLVHAKLANLEDDFDKNFYISSLVKMPKPQEVTFTEELFKLTLRDSKDGEFSGDFAAICQEAYHLAGIKTPLFPKLIENWTENGGEEYYRELRNSFGKQLVTLEDINLMERVIKKARETQPEIMNHPNQINELPIKFTFEGYTFRTLIDRLNIDHENKVVEPYDWKVTYCYEEDKFLDNYLSNRYYIQDFLYGLGVQAYVSENLSGYEIKSFTYVALDDKGLYPTMTHEMEYGLENPWWGFTYRNRTYKGIQQLIEELEWHKESGVWNSTQQTHLNGGKCKHIIS